MICRNTIAIFCRLRQGAGPQPRLNVGVGFIDHNRIGVLRAGAAQQRQIRANIARAQAN